MTTLQARPPYSDAELQRLYPASLELRLVQVFLRHGERAPVAPRFQNTGLHPHWNYCTAVRHLTSPIKTANGWETLNWSKRLETFAPDDDDAVYATGPDGDRDAICLPGELTDRGRETTLALGSRLRKLYIDQLGFLPQSLGDSKTLYLRASPMPRALESVQQTFAGLYPSNHRTPKLDLPPIVTRIQSDEIIYPNNNFCPRFSLLFNAFSKRAAERWNDSEDMRYVNKVLSKWMPEASPKVAVDSHPRLSGILDHINSTLAHSPRTRLPQEFYDPKVRAIVDRLVTEEWFAGFQDSHEYRTLGIGPLVGDITSRMVQATEDAQISEARLQAGHGNRSSDKELRLALSGCHDTTVAGLLAGLGAFDGEKWPPYTSHVAFELFRDRSYSKSENPDIQTSSELGNSKSAAPSSWWSKLFGDTGATQVPPSTQYSTRGRQGLPTGGTSEDRALSRYYVRVRYNDRVMQIPGCKAPGNHLDGDESLCTLKAFKAVADSITPPNWKKACTLNMSAPTVPPQKEPAGYSR